MKLYAALTCLLLATGTNNSTAVKAQINVNDSLALVDLYNSTNGKHWVHHDNWLSRKPVNIWYGITVKENRVTSIRLVDNKLKGTIPYSIGIINKLDTLKLFGNVLSGTIPSSVGNLIILRYLDFGFNRLTDSIPSSIGNLINLTDLRLEYNQLSNTIPVSIGNLVNVRELQLDNNELTGSIPSSIGKLVNVITLYLGYNHLSGEIPFTFKSLKKLSYLSLNHNQLTQSSNIDNLSGHDVYISGNIGFNRFTFDGLEYVAQKVHYTFYAPQAIIPVHHHNDFLSVYAGGTLNNNTYYWYSVGKDAPIVIKGDSTFHPSRSGMYYAIVTNAIVPNLWLITDTVIYIAHQQHQNITASKINIHFSIYPNPATNLLHIQTNGVAHIAITDNDGKVLLNKTINNNDVINVSTFASGIYYIKNKDNGEVQKITVMH